MFWHKLRRLWLRLIVVALVAIALISITAVTDHTHKIAERRPLSGAGWFCAHRGERCAEAAHSASIEARWNKREAIYKASVALLAGAVVVLGVIRVVVPARAA